VLISVDGQPGFLYPDGSMKISEIPFVGYPITDVERSREFYEKLLGLDLSMLIEIDEEKHQFWIEYNIGQSCLAISNAWPPTGSQGGPTAAMEVDDLDKAMEELKTAGASVDSEIMESPACRFFLFSDPDGNPLCMHQMKPEA
jgi:predicted enzyme related to lactoylglutathione lyase